MSLHKMYQNHSRVQTCVLSSGDLGSGTSICLMLCESPWFFLRLNQAQCLIEIVHSLLKFFPHAVLWQLHFLPIASFSSSYRKPFPYRWQEESFHSFHCIDILMFSRGMLTHLCSTVSLIYSLTFCLNLLSML